MSGEALSEPFTADEVAGMIRHMNAGHTDSVLAYARHIGGHRDATDATLRKITARAMELRVGTPRGTVGLEIPFDHRLESSHDAHMTLIRMSKQSKRALTGPQMSKKAE